VDSSKIDRKLIVDKDEDVIISSEREGLSSLVDKSSSEFEGKSVVMSLPVITKSSSINWVEVLVVILVYKTVASSSVTQCHRNREGNVVAWNVNVPVTKLCGIKDTIEGSSVKDW